MRIPGSFKELGPNWWEYTYDVDPGPGKKRKQKRKRWRNCTRKQAEQKAMQIQRELAQGTHIDPAKMTVAEFLDLWLREVVNVRAQPQTQKNYAICVRQIQEQIGSVPLSKLAGHHVQTMYRTFSERFAPGTVRVRHTVLHSALEKAVQWNYIARNPADHAELPPMPPTKSKAITREEALKVLEVAHADPKGLAVIVALGMGLRLGEVSALRWCDVDFDAGTITVEHSLQLDGVMKSTKSGEVRSTAMPAFVRIALQEQKAKHDATRAALGKDWNPNGMVLPGTRGAASGKPLVIKSSDVMARICKRAGIEYRTLHSMRHSFISFLLDAGENPKAVAAAAGHSVTVMMRVYAHELPGSRRKLSDRMDDLLG